MKLSLYVCEMCGKDYATSPYTRGIEEGRRQVKEKIQDLISQMYLKDTKAENLSEVSRILQAIQAIPVKKEPTT